MPKPPGLAVDDIICVMIEVNAGTGHTVTPPSNWTQYNVNNSAAAKSARFAWKKATSADVAATTFTFSCASVIWAYGAFALVGVDPANPYEVHLIEQDTGLNQSAPRPTTDRAECIVVQAAGLDDSTTSVTSSQIQNITRASRGSASMAMGTIDAPNSGLTPNGTWNLSTSRNAGHIAIAFAAPTGIAHSLTLTDALSSIDAPLAARQRARSVAENMQGQDSTTRALARGRTPGETLSIADLTQRGLGRGRTFADTLNSIDAALSARKRTRSLAESVQGQDSTVRVSARNRSLSEALSIADPAQRSVGRIRSSSEPLSMADLAQRSVGRIRTLTDALPTSDFTQRLVGRGRAAVDAIGATDSLVRSFARPLTEVVELDDAYFADRSLGFVDAVDVADSIDRGYGIDLVESLDASDLYAKALMRSVEQTDMASLSDVLSRNTGRVLFDSNILSDAIQANLLVATGEHARELIENLGIRDSRAVTRRRGRTILDSLGIWDGYYVQGGLFVVTKVSRIVEVMVFPATEIAPIYLDSAVDRRLTLLEAVRSDLEVD